MDNVSIYRKNLIEAVLNLSEANSWDAAVDEWEIDDVEEDETLSESCVCGKENLRYLFTIRNTYNGNTLFYIGSQCIKKFGRGDLDYEVTLKEKQFKLLHAIENNDFLELSPEYFSRNLLKYLYDIGAFKPTSYNDFNPYNDYAFMLDMFNKRNRTQAQEKKATAIILNSIRPFLRNMLYEKIRRNRIGR